MSFGFSIGDFFAAGQLAWQAKEQEVRSKKSPTKVQRTNSLESVFLPERQKLTCTQTVIALHTAIKELEDEIENPDSILNRTGASKKSELGLLVKNCMSVLQQLNQLLIKYKSLGTRSKRTWDRVRFGTENLQEIRDKLMVHTSSLTLFLTTLGTGSLGRIEKKLDELIADVRAGRRADTVLSMADDEEDEAEEQWQLWKGELIEEGLSKTELEEHKHWILAKLLERMEKNGLEDPPLDGETVSKSEKGKAPEQSSSQPPATPNVKKRSEKNADSSPPLGLEPPKWASRFQATVEDAGEDSEDLHDDGDKDAAEIDAAEVMAGPTAQSKNPSCLPSKPLDTSERPLPKSDAESELRPILDPIDVGNDDMNHYSSDSDASSTSLVTCVPADSISQVGQTPRTREPKGEYQPPNSSTLRRTPPGPASWVIDNKGVCYPKKYLPTIDDEDNPRDRNVPPQESQRATPNRGVKNAGDILEPIPRRNRTKISKTKTSIPVRGAQKSGDQTEDDEILEAAQHDRNESHPRTAKKPVGQQSLGQNRAHSRKSPGYHGEVPDHTMRPDPPLPDPLATKSFDPNCAVCSRPATAQCDCEARAFDLALTQSELRSCAQDFNTRRAWVREHSQNYILAKFSSLCSPSRETYETKVAQLTERAQFYYHAPPHPSDISNAKEEFKRSINRDWKKCVAMYPKTMDYFFSLVDMNLPNDKDPKMDYLRVAGNGFTGYDLEDLVW